MKKAALVVTYDPPPIPEWKSLAYEAHVAGWEPGQPIARAGTAREAIRRLAEDRWEYACAIADDDTSAAVRRALRQMRGIE